MIKKRTQARRDCLKVMHKNLFSRNGLTHLYNPSEEGIGSYDVHYINAYKKSKQRKDKNLCKERNAA